MAKTTEVIIGTLLMCMLIGGCASAPEHHPYKPPQKIVTLYAPKMDYATVPGRAVSNQDRTNVRTEGEIEKYYNGRYVDPNTGDMYGKGTVYRVVESPHWNSIPNHDPQPYELDEAYKHIHNLANATPLYAELDNKNKTAQELNKTLRSQVEQMKKANKIMEAQTKKLARYHNAVISLSQENQKLKAQNKTLIEKTAQRKTSGKSRNYKV